MKKTWKDPVRHKIISSIREALPDLSIKIVEGRTVPTLILKHYAYGEHGPESLPIFLESLSIEVGREWLTRHLSAKQIASIVAEKMLK